MKKFDLDKDQRNTSEPGVMIRVLHYHRVYIDFNSFLPFQVDNILLFSRY